MELLFPACVMVLSAICLYLSWRLKEWLPAVSVLLFGYLAIYSYPASTDASDSAKFIEFATFLPSSARERITIISKPYPQVFIEGDIDVSQEFEKDMIVAEGKSASAKSGDRGCQAFAEWYSEQISGRRDAFEAKRDSGECLISSDFWISSRPVSLSDARYVSALSFAAYLEKFPKK